jgi:hypothetical protein
MKGLRLSTVEIWGHSPARSRADGVGASVLMHWFWLHMIHGVPLFEWLWGIAQHRVERWRQGDFRGNDIKLLPGIVVAIWFITKFLMKHSGVRSVEKFMNQVEADQEEISLRYGNTPRSAKANPTLDKVVTLIGSVVGTIGLTFLISILVWASLARIFPILEEHPHGWLAVALPLGMFIAHRFWRRTQSALLRLESERKVSEPV